MIRSGGYRSGKQRPLFHCTLGGGIIEYFLGGGALSVPGGTEGTSAIASMKITLHPLAIAAYVGLIVNALSLIPIGSELRLYSCVSECFLLVTAYFVLTVTFSLNAVCNARSY